MSILATLIVNLSLTPALLFSFPQFFYTRLIADVEKTGTVVRAETTPCGLAPFLYTINGHFLPRQARDTRMGKVRTTSGFFLQAVLCCGGSKAGRRASAAKQPAALDTPSTSLLPPPSASAPLDSGGGGGGGAAAESLLEDDTERSFYRLGQSVLRCKYGLVIVCVAASVPGVWCGERPFLRCHFYTAKTRTFAKTGLGQT